MGLIAKITSFFLMLTMVAASGLLATSVTLHDSIDIIAGSSTNSIASSGLTSVAAATGNSIIEPPRVWVGVTFAGGWIVDSLTLLTKAWPDLDLVDDEHADGFYYLHWQQGPGNCYC